MTLKITTVLAVILGASAFSAQSSAAMRQDWQALNGAAASTAITKVACGPQYKATHHRRSSNTVCVFRGVAGGGKLKAKTAPKP